MADTRIHGTTKRHVRTVFETIERPMLLPLPRDRFADFRESRRKVNRDGHVEVARAYDSVPPEYLGREVEVRWDTRLARNFDKRVFLGLAGDQLNWSFTPSIPRKQIFDLATCRFIREARMPAEA